jgi:hypothetical protein
LVPFPCFGATTLKKAKFKNAVFKGGYRENRGAGQGRNWGIFTDEVTLRLKTGQEWHKLGSGLRGFLGKNCSPKTRFWGCKMDTRKKACKI